MKKLIWQNDKWLAIPEIDEEAKKILNDIDYLDKKIAKFKNFDFFYDIQKNIFVKELFYNWYIEGLELAISTNDKERLESIFQGKDNCWVGYVYSFMNSKDIVTSDVLISLHDNVIRNSGKGIRKGFAG
ncbi:MAG: hypothetical protein K6G15_09380, partial [Desulfovibrio sp.]|nr:hypothetical protein [Desulfovibrio sp.]